MLNEEFVEEMYWLAHKSEVYSEFQTTVKDELLKNPKISRYETIERVFYGFVKEGKIEFVTSDVML